MIIGKDNKVQSNDFERYYSYVSFCLPSDKDFENLLNSVWPSTTRAVLKESPTEYGKRMRTKPVYNPVTGFVIDYSKYAPVEKSTEKSMEKSRSGRSDTELIESVRSSLIGRGLRGVLGLYRGFRVCVRV